jgi:hypothetical protein
MGDGEAVGTIARGIVGTALVTCGLLTGCTRGDASSQPAGLQLDSTPQAQSTPQPVASSERARLLVDPDAFLATSKPRSFDKGTLNRYRQLASVTVTNRSNLAVNQLAGTVTWLDAQGGRSGPRRSRS